VKGEERGGKKEEKEEEKEEKPNKAIFRGCTTGLRNISPYRFGNTILSLKTSKCDFADVASFDWLI